MSARFLVACRVLLIVAAVAVVGLPQVAQDQAPPQQPPQQKRAVVMAPLWGSYIALQAFDVHSTRRALSSGAGREANPLMTGVAQNSAGLIAVKAASTAGVIYATGKLWKKNPALAVVTMVALNSATAYVVAHNYRVTR